MKKLTFHRVEWFEFLPYRYIKRKVISYGWLFYGIGTLTFNKQREMKDIKHCVTETKKIMVFRMI